ncbi:MAG: hypothetical protein M3R48_06605 [Candidatus Dormibacteraeota bacterium]|nr:hypothetical protein [Candidatus Dormibacteraeota bacterium]
MTKELADSGERKQIVSVEASAEGVHILGALPPDGGDHAMTVIPWDEAAEVARRVLQLARDHGDVP